jgi:dolichol-phosphate mannosyltransferase
MSNRYLVAIPVFNEEAYLSRVLASVRPFSRHILVIDDGSTDSTPEILRQERGVEVITHPENRGYGKSLADVFCYARRLGFDWLITMDCDEQHEAEQIPLFLSAAAEDDADILSGTRYPCGWDHATAAPQDRREINRRITVLLNQTLGLQITDAFCGFKGYRVSVLPTLRITVPGYAMPMQFWVQVARAGLQVREIPVRLIYKDPSRHFGGILDDPSVRLQHYMDVLHAELRRGETPARGESSATSTIALQESQTPSRPRCCTVRPCSTTES